MQSMHVHDVETGIAAIDASTSNSSKPIEKLIKTLIAFDRHKPSLLDFQHGYSRQNPW